MDSDPAGSKHRDPNDNRKLLDSFEWILDHSIFGYSCYERSQNCTQRDSLSNHEESVDLNLLVPAVEVASSHRSAVGASDDSGPK